MSFVPGARRARRRVAQLLTLCAAALGAVAVVLAVQAGAATGPQVVSALTGPAGTIKLGTKLWVSDHLMGFCRIDGGAVNQSTCITAVGAPGQPAFDAARNLVYVPDTSSKSQGVWRLRYDPATEAVTSPTLLAPGQLSGILTAAVAVDPAGRVLVGSKKTGSIKRILTPAGATQTVQTVGATSDGRGVNGIATVGNAVYIAEARGITRLSPNPTSPPKAALVGSINATAPTAITSDGTDVLYVAETPATASSVLRYTLSTQTQDVYAVEGTLADGSASPFQFVRGLGLDAAGTLYVGDDPSDAVRVTQGRLFQIDAGQAPVTGGQPGTTPPPPAPAPGLKTASLLATGATFPGGSVTMGSSLWVADHTLGFCRVDAGVLNQATCSTAAGSPGQPAFDATRNLVYVPDNSSKSQGVWRLRFDPATGTVGSPTLLAPGQLGGILTTAVALDANGRVLVGAKKNGNIKRINNPAGATQTVQTVGNTSDGRGINGLTSIGNMLYIAEARAVTTLAPDPTSVPKAAPVAAITATGPTAITSDGIDTVYVADTPAGLYSQVLRFQVAAGTLDVYATSGTGANGAFQHVSGLSVDELGNLFVGDDPTGGAQVLQGRLWQVAAG